MFGPEGFLHSVLVGLSSAGMPGIWKERSGKSTPWSEWYIWKTWAKTKREAVIGCVTSFFGIQPHCSSFETLHPMVMQQYIVQIKCNLFLENANRVAFACCHCDAWVRCSFLQQPQDLRVWRTGYSKLSKFFC